MLSAGLRHICDGTRLVSGAYILRISAELTANLHLPLHILAPAIAPALRCFKKKNNYSRRLNKCGRANMFCTLLGAKKGWFSSGWPRPTRRACNVLVRRATLSSPPQHAIYIAEASDIRRTRLKPPATAQVRRRRVLILAVRRPIAEHFRLCTLQHSAYRRKEEGGDWNV